VLTLVVDGRVTALGMLPVGVLAHCDTASYSPEVLPRSTLTTERTGKTRSAIWSCWLLCPSCRSEDVLHDDSVSLGVAAELEEALSLCGGGACSARVVDDIGPSVRCEGAGGFARAPAGVAVDAADESALAPASGPSRDVWLPSVRRSASCG
jgi:hypothetical protein